MIRRSDLDRGYQIDAIVSASNSLARATNSGAKQEQEEAQSILFSRRFPSLKG